MILRTQNQSRQKPAYRHFMADYTQPMARKANVPAGRFLFFAHGIINTEIALEKVLNPWIKIFHNKGGKTP